MLHASLDHPDSASGHRVVLGMGNVSCCVLGGVQTFDELGFPVKSGDYPAFFFVVLPNRVCHEQHSDGRMLIG